MTKRMTMVFKLPTSPDYDLHKVGETILSQLVVATNARPALIADPAVSTDKEHGTILIQMAITGLMHEALSVLAKMHRQKFYWLEFMELVIR